MLSLIVLAAEWFTVEPDRKYTVTDVAGGSAKSATGKQLRTCLPVELQAGKEKLLLIK